MKGPWAGADSNPHYRHPKDPFRSPLFGKKHPTCPFIYLLAITGSKVGRVGEPWRNRNKRSKQRKSSKHPQGHHSLANQASPLFPSTQPFLWEMALMESRVLERMVGSREPKDHKGPIVTFFFNTYFSCMCVFLHVHVFHVCAWGCGGQKRESVP